MQHVLDKAQAAKTAAASLALMGSRKKNEALNAMAQALRDNAAFLLAENEKDLAAGREKGTSKAMLDRLALNEERIEGMAEGLESVARLDDPVGEVMHTILRPNGLSIGSKRVPLGVVGIIYEARPNVTSDAAGLGGSDAIHSNIAIVSVLRNAAKSAGLPEDSIQLIDDTSREAATYMMGLNGVIDVLIPRGGAGLIQSVVKNATVPVIETGTGNCHVYIDEYSDLDMGVNIIHNAKTSRPSVCNAAESLLVWRKKSLRAWSCAAVKKRALLSM